MKYDIAELMKNEGAIGDLAKEANDAFASTIRIASLAILTKLTGILLTS